MFLSVSDHGPCSNDTAQYRRSIFRQYWSKGASISTHKRSVRFRESVTVLEFHDEDSEQTSKRHTATGVKLAKLNVLSLLKEKCDPNLLKIVNVARFSSPALWVTRDDKVIVCGSPDYRSLLQANLTRALIVESNEKYLDLYTRYMKAMIPHLNITTASSYSVAMDCFNQNEDFLFDLILVNHRIRDGKQNPTSRNDSSRRGSDIFCAIGQMKIDSKDQPLLIGTSEHLKGDGFELVKYGADILWGVPPPPVTAKLRNSITMALLNKRTPDGQSDIVIL